MNQLLRFQVQILLIFNLLICYNAVLQERRCGRSRIRNFQGRTLTTTLRMCPLEQIFQEEFDKPVDNVVSAFFPSAQCTKMTRENGRVQRTFYCNQYNLILLSPRHLQFADSSDIVIKTSTTNYTDMHISIEGIVLDWNTKLRAIKMDGKLDFLMSASNLYINSKDLLEKNFGISEEEMRVMGDVNEKNDFEIPTRLPKATLSVVFYPNKYFELMITDVQRKSFFVFQFYPNYVKPVAAYFRTSENVSLLDHLNKLFGITLATGFSPFLELKNLVFSSSTSKINVIMDDYGRNTLEKFTTESARESIPSGKTIRWLIGDLMKIKLKSINVVMPQGESKSTKTSEQQSKVLQQSKKLYQKSKEEKRKTSTKKNQNIFSSNNSTKLKKKGINIGSSIFAVNEGLLKRSIEDENNNELSTEVENNNQESYEENNNKESFEESNNEESFEEANINEESAEGSSDSESTDKDNSSKRSETKTEDNKYSDNIAVELTLPKTSDGDIVITSPDYLKAPFQNLIVSFFPNLNLLVSAPFVAKVRIEEKTYKLTVPDKQVVFSKIVIKPLTKEVKLIGVIDEDWKVAGGLINLKGVNVSVSTNFPEIGKSWNKKPWTFHANGDVPLFSKLITVQILNQENDYIVTGDFQIENMTILTSLFKDATFMNQEVIETFLQPQQLAFEELAINTPLKDPVLRIKATSPMYLAAERVTVSKLKLEIIISSDESNEIKMILGICGTDVNYAELMNQMFNLALQGMSWLNFKNVCLLFSKGPSNEVKYLNDPLLKTVEASGIHMCGNIKVPRKCEFQGNTDKFCEFLRSNSHIIEEAGLMCGSVTSTSHNLHGSSTSRDYHQLSGGSLLQVSESKISVESQNLDSLLRREATKDSEDDYVQHNTKFVVTGKFKTDLPPVISFIGNILVGNSGELELQILEQFKWKSPEDIVVFRFNSGKSVIENGVFNSFAIKTSMNVGFVNKRIEFSMNPLLLINLKDDNVYFIAHKSLTSSSDTVQDLFNAYEKDSERVFFHLKKVTFSRTTAVFSNKDNVSIPELGDYIATKGLTFFGKLRRPSGISDYKITVDSAGTFNYMEHMPLLNLIGGKFVMSQSPDNTVTGPFLLASGEKNKKELHITLNGYLQSLGVFKENTVLTFGNNGEFEIIMNQRFFGEAPAQVKIQENGFRGYLNIQPVITVSLLPAYRRIEKKVEDYFKTFVKKIQNILSGSKINGLKFNTITDVGFIVMNISSAMQLLNDRIQEKLQSIQSNYEQFESSCVEECNKQGKVKVPGLEFNEASQKMVYNPTMYESVDVSCVATCESKKSVTLENFSRKIVDATKDVAEFEILEKKVYQLESIYRGYSCAFKSEINYQEKLKRALDEKGLLQKTLELFEKLKDNKKFFKLKRFYLRKMINSIRIESDKCVPNFNVHFEMFEEEHSITDFEQCFNGEYRNFFAKKLIERYLGKETFNHYNLLIKESVAASAKFKALTRFIKKSLRLALNDNIDVKKELIETEQNKIYEYCASLEAAEKRDNTMQVNAKPGYVTFGENIYLLPVLKQAERNLLVKSKSCTTRSLNTRLAFMYSSPWAAIDVFDPKSSLTNANIKIQNIKSNLSQCDHTNAVINQYHGLYNTIHSLVDSYKESNLRVSSINKAIEDAVLTAKSTIYASKENSTIADTSFWFNQVERGMKAFADIASEKFKSYSSTAFQNIKTKYEDSLKRQGVPSLALYMDSLKKQLRLAYKKMQVPSMPSSIGAVSAARLSNTFVSMFNKPKLSLEDLGHYDLKLKKYISSVNHMPC